jgi:hypothetical protein
MTGPRRRLNDFAVRDDGNPVDCIRQATEHANGVWLWNVTIPDYGRYCCPNASKFAIRPVLSEYVSCCRYPPGKGSSGPDRRF